MGIMTDSLLRLSQSHLALLETCPPQFQLRYLAQSASPPSSDRQAQAERGSQFHLLVQQKLLGLTLPPNAESEALMAALDRLVRATPELWQANPNRWQEAEHCRTLLFRGYLLSAVYDLLAIEGSKARILDWKTYSQPRKSAELVQNWQTRLYLYILSATTDFAPEQLSMTYWFVPPAGEPKSLTFTYSQDMHDRTRADLDRLLSQLEDWLTGDRDRAFPHRPDCQTACPFASDDPSALEDLLHWQDFLETIPEIPVSQTAGGSGQTNPKDVTNLG